MFVAPGAAITVLDVTTLPSTTPPAIPVLERFKIPECSPLAMRYHQMASSIPGEYLRRLFIAGGTMGLWEVDLCPALFSANPGVNPCGSYTPKLVDRLPVPVVPPLVTQQWKRCVDVAVVENNATAQLPLLFALFASRADSSAGPSELHAYLLGDDGSISAYGALVFPSSIVDPTMSPLAVGRALAVDAADSDHLYVALGRGGLRRVDITSATFSSTALSVPACEMASCPYGEEVRDVEVAVTTGYGSVLYAALDYGRVLEYQHPSSPSPSYAVVRISCTANCTPTGNTPCSFCERLAVAALDDHRVVVAVGTNSRPGLTNDTRAPFRTTGIWSDVCIAPGISDPNGLIYPGGDGSCQSVFLLRRDLSASPPATKPLESHFYGEYWGSLALQPVLPPQIYPTYRLYECTNNSASTVREIAFDSYVGNAAMAGMEGMEESAGMGGIGFEPPPTVSVLGTHVDRAFPAADGVVSLGNPGMTFFTLDGHGWADLQATMLYIDPGPPFNIVPVQDTLGLCGSTTITACGLEPVPFYSEGVFGCAHWIDPNDSSREVFMPGASTYLRLNPVPNCGVNSNQCGDPCASPRPTWTPSLLDAADPSAMGWRYQRFTPGTTQQPTGSSLNLRWGQFPAPTNNPNEKDDLAQYASSELHPGDARLVMVVRAAARDGLKALDRDELDFLASTTCAPAGGFGERLPQNGWPSFWEAQTHMEREDSDGSGIDDHRCRARVPCSPTGGDRNYINARSKTYSVQHDGGTRWITIVAAGHVVADPLSNPAQPVQCQWDDYSSKGELVIYDTTDSAPPALTPPTLLRVGLGPTPITPPNGIGGSFWAVDVKTYPPESELDEAKSFAFVADLLGRVQVFDVSPSRLFSPALTLPYLPYPAPPPSQANPILTPSHMIEFDPEPADGLRPNCIDLEIDNNYAYVTLGRGGIAVINVSANPLHTAPTIHEVIDTPGITMGLTFRRVAGVATHLVVGDSRAGMRMYRRGP